MSSSIFKAGGPLFAKDNSIYIERDADREIIHHVRKMNYIMCIESRQRGKTSLVFHLMNHPDLNKYKFVYLDITAQDKTSQAKWYQTLSQEILYQLGKFIKKKHKPDIPQNYYEWRLFLRHISQLITDSKKRLIIALDEIGAVAFPGSTDFFSILRNIYTSRDSEPCFKQLTFILAGAFHPQYLIEDKKVSPFNIAHRIRLYDFSPEQVEEIVRKGKWNENETELLAKRIYFWTGGQPYLTQLICSYLDSASPPYDVDLYMDKLVREDDNHLPSILKRIENDYKLKQYIHQILTDHNIPFYPQENKRQAHLELLGLVKADENGKCKISNRLYAKFLQPVSYKPKEEQYIGFDLHITRDGSIQARSDQNKQTAQITLPIPEDMNSILESIQNNNTDDNMLLNLGIQLYKMLFPHEIMVLYKQTVAMAKEKKKSIRIRLQIDSDTHALLPWELSYIDEEESFLSIHSQTVFSRYINLPAPQNRIGQSKERLNVLLIISNPVDQMVLYPDEWEFTFLTILYELLQNGKIKITIVKHATRKEITNTLHTQNPDIIHFVGHGIYQNNKGYLAFVDENHGGTWKVDDVLFAELFLGKNDKVSLVCFSTSESTIAESPKGFSNIATHIVSEGVSAVVVMQYHALVKTTKLFFKEFYTAITSRKPVDCAVQCGRKKISEETGLGNREFASPVLYMRIKDGRIF